MYLGGLDDYDQIQRFDCQLDLHLLFVYYTAELIRLGIHANGSGLITLLVCLIAWIVLNIMNFGALRWVIINTFFLPKFKR